MKGKIIILMLAVFMFGAGFLSIMEVVAGELPKVPSLKVLNVSIGYQVNEKPEKQVEVFSYEVDPVTGCIQNIKDKEGIIPRTTKPPSWLVKGKEILYSGIINGLQCQQSIIGIGSSPIEYWVHGNGYNICVGAWDPECGEHGKWHPRCNKPYVCP